MSTALAAGAALRQPRVEGAAAGQVLGGGGAAMRLEPLDLLAEPGELTSYRDSDRFYDRQDRLAAARSAPDAALDGRRLEQATRRLGDLPAAFWVQILVGVGALLISGWVWALRPFDLACGLFALSGASTLAFTHSAAVYSTRALALPSSLFKSLTLINMVGASIFGVAMIGLFLVYPRRLRLWRPLMGGQAAAFLGWTALAAARRLPNAQFGGNAITMVEMVFILAAIVAQHRATRRRPQERAALVWLGVSVAVGAGGFILLSATPAALGLGAPVEQGYAFLFFLLIYLGLAAGLRRYRLFEVGDWGVRLAFYAVGAALVFALDGLLLLLFGLQRAPAFSIAILVVSLIYLPFRDQLWRLATRKRPIETHDALASALEVAFAATPDERTERWRGLLQRAFDPLRIEPAGAAVPEPKLADDGARMLLPGVAGLEGLELTHAHGGRRLFTPAELKLANQLTAVVDRVEQGRRAYERGVGDERRRVAQDLHDDVGARLLSGLHAPPEAFQATLRAVLSDIRAIVRGITGESVGLSAVLADMRYEAARRLEPEGVELVWPLLDAPVDPSLDYRRHKAITSAVRETVSNVVRHAGARRLKVDVQLAGAHLDLTLADDGRGVPADVLSGETAGFGLKSIGRRMQDVGGQLQIRTDLSGTAVTLRLPLHLPPGGPH